MVFQFCLDFLLVFQLLPGLQPWTKYFNIWCRCWHLSYQEIVQYKAHFITCLDNGAPCVIAHLFFSEGEAITQSSEDRLPKCLHVAKLIDYAIQSRKRWYDRPGIGLVGIGLLGLGLNTGPSPIGSWLVFCDIGGPSSIFCFEALATRNKQLSVNHCRVRSGSGSGPRSFINSCACSRMVTMVQFKLRSVKMLRRRFLEKWLGSSVTGLRDAFIASVKNAWRDLCASCLGG